jgi:drug/metabolite transporter (DMT)-like permease
MRQRAVIMLLCTAALWSTSGLLIKLISWGPLAIMGGRSLIASFVVLAYLRGHVDIRFTRYQVLGAICYVLVQVFFISATKLTTAANAIFLQYACPIYLVILGYWFLKEKPQRADWVAMGVIIAGLALFFSDQLSFSGLYGNILAILSGMAFAGTMLFMRLQKDGTPANTVLLGNILAAVVGLPFVFLFHEKIQPTDIGIILYLGILQIGLSYVLYSIAIKHIHVLEANLILALEPILNPIWVFLVIGEKPGLSALLGGILVIGAVTFRAVVSARTPEVGPAPAAVEVAAPPIP